MNQLIVLPSTIDAAAFAQQWQANSEAPDISPASDSGQTTYGSPEILSAVYTILGSVAVNVASNLIYDALRNLFGRHPKAQFKVEKTEPSPGTIVWIVREEESPAEA